MPADACGKSLSLKSSMVSGSDRPVTSSVILVSGFALGFGAVSCNAARCCCE
jgi:hypothetical protein